MNDQELDNWIANHEQGQKQSHAHKLRQIKYEFHQLRDDQRRERIAALHDINPITPPPKLEARSSSLDLDAIS
jgi:hypothetical protein